MRGRPNLGPQLVPLQKKGWRQPMYYIRWSQNGRSHEVSTGHHDLRDAEREFRNWTARNEDKIPGKEHLALTLDAEIARTIAADKKRRKWLGLDLEVRERDPVVYFMRAGDDGPIKIGFATDVNRRRQDLQTAQAYTLHIIATIPGNRFTEQRILERFRPLRMNGEWHRPEPELLSFIDHVTSGLYPG